MIIVVVRVGHTSIQASERTIAILRDLATAPILMVLTGIKAEKNPYLEYGDRRWSSDDEIAEDDDEYDEYDEYDDDELGGRLRLRRRGRRRRGRRRRDRRGRGVEADDLDDELDDDDSVDEPVSSGSSSALHSSE